VAVDEVMQRFKGRSHDTLTILTKPTSEGYKIWVVADEGYVLVWIYHQRGKGPLDVKVPKELGSNKTATVVVDLLDQLSKQSGYAYGVFLDNLFTSHKLLLYLRRRGYGVTGTARSNFGIYKNFVQLKNQDKKQDKILWGELKMVVTSDNQMMQFAWQDNSVVLFQSTMFDGQAYIIRDRKRSSRTSISAKTARAPFGNKPRAKLSIPDFDDVYNHYMGAVDQADSASSLPRIPCNFAGSGAALLEGVDGLELDLLATYSLDVPNIDLRQYIDDCGSFLLKEAGQKADYLDQIFQLAQLYRNVSFPPAAGFWPPNLIVCPGHNDTSCIKVMDCKSTSDEGLGSLWPRALRNENCRPN
jgi:hypothetical protein